MPVVMVARCDCVGCDFKMQVTFDRYAESFVDILDYLVLGGWMVQSVPEGHQGSENNKLRCPACSLRHVQLTPSPETELG